VAISFEIIGLPVAQGSMRAFSLKNGGYAMVATNAAKLKPWRLEMKETAASALAGFVTPGAIAVRLELDFRFPRPGGHFGKRGIRPSAPQQMFRRPDLDKLIRAVLDALKDAGAFRDDAQVDAIRARKRYCSDGEVPGVEVRIL
jgi:Holliday junction resolvase RusA-like endonuclease